MTKRFLLGVVAAGTLTWTVGCARENPVAPSDLTVTAAGGPLTELTTTSYPVVTLQPDLTANPSEVTVSAGDPIVMVNKSPQYVRVRSYNCDQFLIVGLQPGASKYTWPFGPAGTTCDYFAWDANWKKIFVGRVVVR